MAFSFCWLTLPSRLISRFVSCGVATSLLVALAFELWVDFALYILSWHPHLCWSPNLPCISTVWRLLWIWSHAIAPSLPAPSTHTVQGKEALLLTNPVACCKNFYFTPTGTSSALALQFEEKPKNSWVELWQRGRGLTFGVRYRLSCFAALTSTLGCMLVQSGFKILLDTACRAQHPPPEVLPATYVSNGRWERAPNIDSFCKAHISACPALTSLHTSAQFQGTSILPGSFLPGSQLWTTAPQWNS